MSPRAGWSLSRSYVLNHSTTHFDARKRRRNNIQDRLVKATKGPRNISANVIVNQSVTGTHGEERTLRPDIVVRDEGRKTITIIDVCVPFDIRLAAVEDARNGKIRKYEPLVEQLRQMGYKVKVEAFVVGALGAWDNKKSRAVNLFSINRSYARGMRRLMVSDTVRGSRDIYVGARGCDSTIHCRIKMKIIYSTR